MKKYNVNLADFTSKGQVECELRNSMLFITNKRSIPTQRFDAEHLSINSYTGLPGKYKLPLRIDITAKIDAPGMYVLIGNGHVNFGTLWSDNRRIDDIAVPNRKTKFFHNYIPLKEFVEISLIYDMKEMQILVNGEARYYSQKERYMKAPAFREMNRDGFEIKITCDKLADLCIKAVSITEYDNSCGIVNSEMEPPTAVIKNIAIAAGEKPTFEKCISLLPENIKREIISIDEYLRTPKLLNFKRQLEKNGNKITYVPSEYGLSYAIYLSNDIFDHSLQWYLITNGKPETWHRKANMLEETLDSLARKIPDFADRMFNNLDECVGCYKACLARTRYKFQNKQKAVCHGKLKFKMDVTGFEDVRTFINEVSNLVLEMTR